jgi:hypothetical protein
MIILNELAGASNQARMGLRVGLFLPTAEGNLRTKIPLPFQLPFTINPNENHHPDILLTVLSPRGSRVSGAWAPHHA